MKRRGFLGLILSLPFLGRREESLVLHLQMDVRQLDSVTWEVEMFWTGRVPGIAIEVTV